MDTQIQMSRVSAAEIPPAHVTFNITRQEPVRLVFKNRPFIFETEEGEITVSPKTMKDWEGGYFVAYPAEEGGKPFLMSPRFYRTNCQLASWTRKQNLFQSLANTE